MKDETPHGVGRQTGESIYEGQFRNGLFHGFGRLFQPDKSYYIGLFEDGKKHGKGTEIMADGDKKEGEFEYDEFQGFEEYDSEDERKQDEYYEMLQKQVIAPLTEEQIKELIKSKLQRAVERQFKYQRSKFINMDKYSGLYVPFVCRDQFYYLVKKRQWRYIIYNIEEHEHDSVEIDKCGPRSSSFAYFVASMPADEPRWVVYDFEYEVTEHGMTRKKSKLLFIVYRPDESTDTVCKNLILFRKDHFKKSITDKTGVHPNIMEYKASCQADLDYDTIKRKIM